MFRFNREIKYYSFRNDAAFGYLTVALRSHYSALYSVNTSLLAVGALVSMKCPLHAELYSSFHPPTKQITSKSETDVMPIIM